MPQVDEVMLKQCTLKVAFIVADDTDLDGDSELHIYNSIHGRIASIDLFHQNDIDSGSANLEKYDLILVSDKVTYTNVDGLTTLKVPIISFNGGVSNNVLHIGSSNGNSTETETNITDQTHNITREQTTGNNQKIYNPLGGGPVDYIGGISFEAVSLAEDTITSAQKHLVVLDRNKLLANGEKAPELRLHFGFYHKNKLTNLGKTLFSESIMYGLCGRGPLEVDVRQISERIENYKNIPLIALIVGDKTNLDDNTEEFFKDRLEENYIVHIYDDGDIDDGTANLESYDLIIVSKQVADANIDELTTLERPILSMKGSISAAKLYIGSTSGNNATETNINITDNTHNITRDQSTGSQVVYISGSGLDYIETLGIGAVDLAVNPADTSEKYIVAVDEGKRLKDDTRAPDHRIHFGLYQGNQLNDLSLVLFDETVQYGLAGAKRIDVNIEGDVDQILPAVSFKTVPEIGFIVADKSNLNSDTEEVFYNRLSEICNVTLIDDDDVDAGNMNLRKFNAIIISHEVDQTKLDVELPILKIPILSMKGEVSDDILKIGTTNGEGSGNSQTKIEDITHIITAGESIGNKYVYSTAATMDYIGNVSSDAMVLTRDIGTAAEKHLVVVNKYRILADNSRAPERRIHFAFLNGRKLTDLGWRLFDNAVEYLFRGYYQEIDVISRGSRIFGIFKGISPLGQTPGNVYFVDYNNGDDNNDGLTIQTAKKTINVGHDLLSANQDDVLLVLPGDYNGETVTCDVSGVHILGAGPNRCNGLRFVVSADHVEIAGFTIDHGGTANPVEISGDYCWLHDNYIQDGGLNKDGILLDTSKGGIIENNVIRNNNAEAIDVNASGPTGSTITDYRILNNYVYKNSGGITLNSDNVSNNLICGNYIMDNTFTSILLNGNNNYAIKNYIKGCLTYNDYGTNNRWIENNGIATKTTFDRTPAHGTNETDVKTGVIAPRAGLCAVKFNLSDFTDGGTITLRIENSSGDVFGKVDFIITPPPRTEVNPTIEFWVDGGDIFDITIQTSQAVGSTRTLEYEIIFGDG
jgi:hypothetical protein